jgi:phytoene synthase
VSEATCAALVQKGDPDRYIATLAAPPSLRADLFTLYAFNLEVVRVPWLTKETMIAEMRLQWWRDVVTEAAPRAHDVAGPMQALAASRRLPPDMIDQMIGARLWDVYSDPFEDQAAFDRYIDQTSGNLMWLAALLCGAQARAEPVVRDYAFAAGLANFLIAVPELEARGRRPLFDGRPAAVSVLARAGLDRLAAARAQRSQVGAGTPALLPGWQAGAILAQAADDPNLVARGALGLSEFSRRGRLAFQALTGRW